MIQIPLGGRRAAGRVAIVDDRDDWALLYRWSLDGNGYVQRGLTRSPGKRDTHKLHREVLDFPTDIVDHINRDRLDNRRSNLRIVTAQMNSQNTPSRGGTSRFRGVYRHTQMGQWVATACLNGKNLYLGLFLHEEDAAEVSREWRRLNMPGALD